MTISDLQGKMGLKEFNVWSMYRSKYGPLNPVRKYDQGHALVASQVNNAHGGKAKPIDFMPYAPKREQESIEDFISSTFGNGVLIGKRR